jgi:hypothetical protein
MSEICVNPELQSPYNVSSKDKFILILNLPKILRETLPRVDDSSPLNKIEISIFGSVVPSIAVEPIDVRYGGQTVKFSSHSRPAYGPLNVNFIVDNKYENYFILWKWLEILNDPTMSVYNGTNKPTNSNETEYQTTFSILALNEYNKPSIEFRFHNAFLTRLGEINYDYKNGDLLESTAEFHFSQLTMDKIKNIAEINK